MADLLPPIPQKVWDRVELRLTKALANFSLEANLIEITTQIIFPTRFQVNDSPSDLLKAAQTIAPIVESWAGRIVSLLPDPETLRSDQEEAPNPNTPHVESPTEITTMPPTPENEADDLSQHELRCNGNCGRTSTCKVNRQKRLDQENRLQHYREIAFTALCQASSRVETVQEAEDLAHSMLGSERAPQRHND
jgi:hypothetical protein